MEREHAGDDNDAATPTSSFGHHQLQCLPHREEGRGEVQIHGCEPRLERDGIEWPIPESPPAPPGDSKQSVDTAEAFPTCLKGSDRLGFVPEVSDSPTVVPPISD